MARSNVMTRLLRKTLFKALPAELARLCPLSLRRV